MKKMWPTILFLFLSVVCRAQQPSIEAVRSLHQKAPTDEKSCEKLIRFLSPYSEKDAPVLYGYKASAVMMMAKHTFNPFSKLSYFKKGKKMLETAVAENYNNTELRFLRFAAQTNAPSFLGYHHHIEKDRQFLMKSLPRMNDPGLKKIILSYLKTSGHFSNS